MVAHNARLSFRLAVHMRFCKITASLIQDMTICIYAHLNILITFYIDKIYWILNILLLDCMASVNMPWWHIMHDFLPALPFIFMRFCKITASLIQDMTICIYAHLNILITFYIDKIYWILNILLLDCMASVNMPWWHIMHDFLPALPFIFMRFCKITASLIQDMTICIYAHLNILITFYIDEIYWILYLLLLDCMASVNMPWWHIMHDFLSALPFICGFVKLLHLWYKIWQFAFIII